jgi:hypothetical protein
MSCYVCKGGLLSVQFFLRILPNIPVWCLWYLFLDLIMYVLLCTNILLNNLCAVAYMATGLV